MRVITLNCNGIRSAASKGFLAWLARQRADVVCLQEVKAHEADLPAKLASPAGWHAYFHTAAKRGYSGVAIFSRRAADRVSKGLGIAEIDAEGRYIEAAFGEVSVASVYLPSGSASEAAQAKKFRFLEQVMPKLRAVARSRRHYVLAGDWNIAHHERDLANWRGNRRNSGFLPEERAWLTSLFDEVGLVDVFRTLDPNPGRYTWWSNRGEAWAKNVGWRIDYQIATRRLAALAVKTRIHTRTRFSDHAPLIIDYGYSL
jgi:exodeoxyribonuclease-3